MDLVPNCVTLLDQGMIFSYFKNAAGTQKTETNLSPQRDDNVLNIDGPSVQRLVPPPQSWIGVDKVKLALPLGHVLFYCYCFEV
eukprot:735160-Pelagomonas_calceolata.AAC.1